MSQQLEENGRPTPQKTLLKNVELRPERRPVSGILFGISLAVLGGFLGGVITNYGPTYLHLHLTQAHLQPVAQTPEVVYVKAEPKSIPDKFEVETPAPDAKSNLPENAEARLIVDSGSQHYILLSADAKSKWAGAKSQLRRHSQKDGMVHTYVQKAGESLIPSEFLSWKNRKVSLYDSKGFRCTANIGQFVLLQQVADDFPDDKVVTWDNPDSIVLAAQLKGSQGRCANAIWARDSSLPAPAIARHTKASGALRKLAKKTFRTSSDYQAIQKDFRKDGKKGPWDQFEFDSLQMNLVTGSSETLLRISAAVGGCGYFGAELSQLYRVSKDNTLTRIASEGYELDSIDTAVDFDGDGDLDFVVSGEGWDYALVKQDSQLRELMRNPVSVYMCRC